MERSQLRRRAQLCSIDIDQTKAPAAREHLLISFGEGNVYGSIWDHEDFQQSIVTRCSGGSTMSRTRLTRAARSRLRRLAIPRFRSLVLSSTDRRPLEITVGPSMQPGRAPGVFLALVHGTARL